MSTTSVGKWQELRTGVGIGAALAAWATLIRLVAGTAPFEERGFTYPTLAAFYIISGAVTGGLVSLLRPYVMGTISRFFASTIASIPFALIAGVCYRGSPLNWTENERIAVVFSGVFATIGFIHLVFADSESSAAARRAR